MRRVAVVGRGAVTPVSNTFAGTFAGLLAGRGAVGPIRRFDASSFPVRIGAEVASRAQGVHLVDELIDAVVAEATAGLDLSAVPDHRRGVFMGNEATRPDLADLARGLDAPRLPDLAELARLHPAWQSVRVARATGATGATATHATACASSGQALGEAVLAVRRGEADLVLAGGVDVLVHPLMVTGFARLGALSTRNDAPERASRPFDVDRDGFVLGEGAGLVVLVAEHLAEQVGPVLGWISGYGCSANAWRITDSPPDGRGAADAMSLALADAGRAPDAVVYINAHGTSTPAGDIAETRAVKLALGDQAYKTPVSSTKSMTGHMLGAAGGAEAIFTILAIRDQVAPPTINYETPDPECDLDCVPNTAREMPIEYGLTNSFGFGGTNGTLIFRRI